MGVLPCREAGARCAWVGVIPEPYRWKDSAVCCHSACLPAPPMGESLARRGARTGGKSSDVYLSQISVNAGVRLPRAPCLAGGHASSENEQEVVTKLWSFGCGASGSIEATRASGTRLAPVLSASSAQRPSLGAKQP